ERLGWAELEPSDDALGGSLDGDHAAGFWALTLHCSDELGAASFGAVGQPVLPGVLIAGKVQVATVAVMRRAIEQSGEGFGVTRLERGEGERARHQSEARSAPASISDS